MAEIGKEGPHFDYQKPGQEGGGAPPGSEQEERGGFDPEKRWSSSLLEKVASSETDTPEKLKWRTWRLLEGIVDRADDWTARMARDRMEFRLEQMEEVKDDELAKYLGRDKEKERVSDTFYEEFQEIKNETDAFLTLFIDFGNYYEKVAPRGENLAKVSFGNEILELNPTKVLERVFSLRGFKEEEGWPDIGDQIDTAVRAYTLLALQYDDRENKQRELEWALYQDPSKPEGEREPSEGIKTLFPGEKPLEQYKEWLRRLKMKVFVHTESEIRDDLKDITYEKLLENEELLEEVDKRPVFNRFAVGLTMPVKEAIEESIRELATGKESGTLVETQARIAEKLGRKVFYYFGLASSYGGQVEFNDEGEVKDAAAEGHPWADGFLDSLDLEAKNEYNIIKGYWAGPEPFPQQAPEKLFVHLFKYVGVRDPADRGNTEKTKSLWNEMWKDGKRMGDLSWDRVADYAVKSYWIRYIFIYREQFGLLPAFMGDPWVDEPDMLTKNRFWIELRKSMNIVARSYLITEGDYQGWIDKHRAGIEKRQKEIFRNKKSKYKEKFDTEEEMWHQAWKDAIVAELDDETAALKRRWKSLIKDEVEDWWGTRGMGFRNDVRKAMERAGFMED